MDITGTRLRLYYGGFAFGPGKADLLEAIAAEGSISAAGRSMGMSYRRAWNLVEEMNTAFEKPLVQSSRGGSRGGGAALTPEGEAVLGEYRALMEQVMTAGGPMIRAIGARLRPDAGEEGKEDGKVKG